MLVLVRGALLLLLKAADGSQILASRRCERRRVVAETEPGRERPRDGCKAKLCALEPSTSSFFLGVRPGPQGHCRGGGRRRVKTTDRSCMKRRHCHRLVRVPGTDGGQVWPARRGGEGEARKATERLTV